MLRISLALSLCLVAWEWSCCSGADPLISDVSDLPVKDAVEKDREVWLKKLKDREFSTLEEIAADLQRTNAKYRDGRSRLWSFYSSLGAIQGSEFTEQDYLDRIALVDEWLVKNPKTVVGRTVLSRAWFRYGYFARGGDSGSKVSDENHKKFQERSERASELLDEIEKTSPQLDLGYYELRLDISKGLSKKPDRQWVYSMLEIDPFNREVVASMALCLLPRWFGEPGEVEQFADEIVRRTAKSGAGEFHYAIVALLVFTNTGESVFLSHRLEWPRIRQGFLDLEKRYPQAREHSDRFARLAILANDPKTAHEVMERMGETLNPNFWSPLSFPVWKQHLAPEMLKGDQKQLIMAHHGTGTMLELRNGGKAILSCDELLILRTHDFATGRTVSANLLPDGNPQSASASGSANLVAWGLAEQPGVKVSQLIEDSLKAIPTDKPAKLTQFTTDGSRLAVADENGNIAIFDLKTDKSVKTVSAKPPTPVHEMRFSANGQWLAAVSDDGLIRIVAQKADKDVRDWNVGESNLCSVAWSLKGDRLAVGDREGHVQVFTWPARRPLRTLNLEPAIVAALEFSPDGRQLAIGLCGDTAETEVTDPLRLVTVVGNDPPIPLNGHKLGVRKIRFQMDGKRLVSSSDDWTIRTWELKNTLQKK